MNVAVLILQNWLPERAEVTLDTKGKLVARRGYCSEGPEPMTPVEWAECIASAEKIHHPIWRKLNGGLRTLKHLKVESPGTRYYRYRGLTGRAMFLVKVRSRYGGTDNYAIPIRRARKVLRAAQQELNEKEAS